METSFGGQAGQAKEAYLVAEILRVRCALLRMTNERNGLLTVRLQDAGKNSPPIFLPEAVSIQVYHEILAPPPYRDF